MFGSRLRSWMENHIVRPRKRNNKNKQSNGNIETSKKETVHLHSNGFSSTSTAVNSNGNANHCCGNGIVASPSRRREVSPIQNHSRYGWQSPDSEIITSPKSDNFLYAPKNHRYGHEPGYRHQFDPKNEQSAPLSEPKCRVPTHTQQQLHPENSSSSFSSLSWSTGSKEQSAVSIEKHHEPNERSKSLQVPIITYQTPNETNDLDEEAETVHYEEIQTTILRHPDTTSRSIFFQERPKSEQLTTFAPLQRQADYTERRSIDDSSSARYGKLLPSRIPWKGRGSSESLTAGSAECLPWQKPLNTNGGSTAQHYRLRNGNKPATGNTFKGNGVPLNSLSSPESAYSTGYSTDGTSPGACYNQAPEYYINMRTGTHYFPKTMNSLAIEAQRCKFGLNKIEEMSPIDPLPKTSFAAACNKTSKSNLYVCPGSPYKNIQTFDAQNGAGLPTFNGYESSSPRQRCRIRTNPWVSTQTMLPSGNSFQQSSNTTATSSTICSSRSSLSSVSMQKEQNTFNNGGVGAGGQPYLNDNKQQQYLMGRCDNNTLETYKQNGRALYDSSSSLETEDTKQRTVSLTEVDLSGCPRANTPSALMLAKRLGKRESSAAINVMTSYSAAMQTPVAYMDASEEDATLNEMMGKFDESYVYEKETDILSDSDATNCPSELDTGDAGDDAEDECDTDELLEIDFIDTTSIQETPEKRQVRPFQEKNFGYKQVSEISRRSFRSNREAAESHGAETRRSNSSGRRRKRLIKTRKKSTGEHKENISNSSPLRKSRETRSAGGTPISLRRNAKSAKERHYKTSSLSERASSLVFPHDRGRRYLTVAESNKALLKADLEADFKYRQLIQEAESILVSLKSSAQSLTRETPVSSPRRLNPLINKRVEMLKINEIKLPVPPPQSRAADMEQDFSAVLNKRIELLKHETTSAPNSPRSVPRCSPRKTHITNFINQIDGSRKTNVTPNEHQFKTYAIPVQNRSPLKASPLRRRLSLKGDDTIQNYNFDSETETEQSVGKFLNFGLNSDYKMDVANHNCLPEITRDADSLCKNTYEDYTNHNLDVFQSNEFINIGKNYCPQSEPLKRKVYKGSHNFDRIKCSFNFESERTKPQHMRESRQTQRNFSNSTNRTTQTPRSSNQDLNLNSPLLVNRKQLLLDTLSELKQNLENQSVQLNELNVD